MQKEALKAYHKGMMRSRIFPYIKCCDILSSLIDLANTNGDKEAVFYLEEAIDCICTIGEFSYEGKTYI